MNQLHGRKLRHQIVVFLDTTDLFVPTSFVARTSQPLDGCLPAPRDGIFSSSFSLTATLIGIVFCRVEYHSRARLKARLPDLHTKLLGNDRNRPKLSTKCLITSHNLDRGRQPNMAAFGRLSTDVSRQYF